MSRTVILDVDGMMADFEGRLCRVLWTKFGDRGLCDRSLYGIEDRYADRPEVLKYALEFTADPHSYHALNECEGAVDFAETLLDNDYQIMYVSSRPKVAQAITYRWLLKHTTDPDIRLICGVTDKVKFLQDIEDEVDFVVEDSPYHIAELKKAGFVALCWSQPWNEGIFPRLYVRSDGELMLWADESIESAPFFTAEEIGEKS